MYVIKKGNKYWDGKGSFGDSNHFVDSQKAAQKLLDDGVAKEFCDGIRTTPDKVYFLPTPHGARWVKLVKKAKKPHRLIIKYGNLYWVGGHGTNALFSRNKSEVEVFDGKWYDLHEGERYVRLVKKTS